MIVRVVIGGVLVLAVMIAVQNGWILRRTGLTGSCVVYATASSGAQQEKCSPGRLDGRPDLSNKGCVSDGLRATAEFWSCPAPLQSSPAGV
jgi:hypothetical protein